MIKFYNTLSRKVEELHPVDPDGKTVRMYTCGPTVYNFAHIGNMRTYIWEDFLHRALEYAGFEVERVMNITDVDDKTIRDARNTGIDFYEFTQKYTKAFLEDLEKLHIKHSTHYPKATEFVPQMIEMVKELVDSGNAYIADGSVYYRIDSFAEYGKLSGRTNRGEQRHRIDVDEYDEKEGVQDFALWKAWKPEDGDIKWESPWGAGRPGWHIECSVMAKYYLGNTFDIHCGGVDHIFPHHENEIAQSEAANHVKMANIWLHGEWLFVDNKKMSKSLHNYYTLRDLIDKGYTARAFRFYMLTFNYRMAVNFSFDGLNDAVKRLEKFDDFWLALIPANGTGTNGVVDQKITEYETEFSDSLADDINSARALAVISEALRAFNGLRSQGNLSNEETVLIKKFWQKIDVVLQILIPWEERASLSEKDVEASIQSRIAARNTKDFATADKIRKELLEQGIVLEDTPGGTIWRRK